LGLPQHPRELGLEEDDLVRVLLHAPNTRPGRFTVLEETNLDESSARALVRKIWGEASP
jgi:glycerol-1-phosphate dehydrogenase [NAD(P)+]